MYYPVIHALFVVRINNVFVCGVLTKRGEYARDDEGVKMNRPMPPFLMRTTTVMIIIH